MKRLVTVLSVVALGTACSGAPPPAAVDDAGAIVWGDEYDGVLLDADRDFSAARPASGSVDVTSGASTSTRVLASVGALSLRGRRAEGAMAGAVEWRAARLHAVAGAIRPVVAEGALLSDARDTGAPSTRAASVPGGLRTAPSASIWGSVVGAGASVRAGRTTLAGAAWRPRGDTAVEPVGWASVDWRGQRSSAGLAMGGQRGSVDGASVFGARASGPVFVSWEIGGGRDGARTTTRVVAGDAGEWRGAVATGALRAATDAPGAAGRERWGATIERRDRWGAGSSRLAVSSRTRRGPDGDEIRRRVDWMTDLRVSDRASVETGARATRDEALRAASPLELAVPVAVTHDLRARVALRHSERIGDATRIDLTYRVDTLVGGGERGAGVVLVWQGRVRHGGVDVRLQASVYDLRSGQIGYIGRAALPGAGAFAALSRSGSDLSASIQADWRGHAWAGVQAVARGADGASVSLAAGLAY